MDSRVRSRPNHYETLGLEPTASRGEIAQAFARRMRSPHVMGDAAQIGIAYAVLRDPIRRRDYDRSLGQGARPKPRQWTYRVQPRWEPFIASAAANPVGRPIAPEPHVTAPSSTAPAAPPQPRVEHEPAVRPEAAAEPDVPVFPAFSPVRVEASRDADGGINWRVPVIAVSGLVLSVALLGAWAGITAGREVEAAQAAPATTVALPKARPHLPVAAASLAPVAAPVGAQQEARRSVSSYRSERPIPQPQPTAAGQTIAEAEAGDGQSDALAQDPLAPEPAVAQPATASLPLPPRVIARTIERIGYACGEVASAVEGGAPGVFKVTCTSGHAYTATPVRGRYRFRPVRG